ncbi:MAG: hypothetical protein ACREID_08290, partial [Planctomycetota bacterium]
TLAWGAWAGVGLVATDREPEPGRGLVASCVGLTGALAGLAVAAWAVQAHLFAVLPAPDDGRPLLVRVGSRFREAEVVLVGGGEGSGLALRRVVRGGFEPLVPAGAERAPAAPVVLGKVVFRFGGAWGGGPPAAG